MAGRKKDEAAELNGINHDKKRVSVILQGTSPLLMHRMTEEALIKGGKARSRKSVEVTPKEIAENALYKDDKGYIYFPGAAILKLCADVGGGMKGKGQKSLRWNVGGGLIVDETIEIREPKYDRNGRWDGVAWERATNWRVDTRTVVNHNVGRNGVRVLAHRARIDYWQAVFEATVDERALDVDTVHAMLEKGGWLQGIGAFRPQNLGNFGTYMVKKYEVLKGYEVPVYSPPTYNPDRDRTIGTAK